MMRLLTMAFVMLFVPNILIAQRLDDTAVEAAIRAGEARRFGGLISSCVAGTGFGEGFSAQLAGGVQPTGSYDVTLTGAAGRIATEAAHAKRLYRSFGVDDATAEMRDASAIFVIATPRAPQRSQNTYDVASPIQHIVLKARTSTDRVAQPLEMEIEPVEWGNLMGATVRGTSAVATFAAADVRALPPGDVEIVLVTEAGERRCRIRARDRSRVQ
jgi:hypothetical protein